MGPRNKLLLEIDGVPMVRRVAGTAIRAGLDPVLVVVGHGASDVRRALEGLPVSFAENEHPEAGLSSSLRTGLAALPLDVAGVIVLLGDMPWVEARDVTALLEAFDPTASREICVPVHDGRQGNPVLWSSRFFVEMAALEGDAGARALFERHAASVFEVPVAGAGILRDVDTPEALADATLADAG
jgi:molybdenum cofactor cytidylyltransferase